MDNTKSNHRNIKKKKKKRTHFGFQSNYIIIDKVTCNILEATFTNN